MKEFQKKAKMRKKLCSNFVILILIVILSFLVKGTLGVYLKARKGCKTLQTASVSLSDLEGRANTLTENIDYLQSDVGREEKIRNNFVLAKDGEQAVFIIDEEEEEVEIPEKSGRLKRFWDKIVDLVK